MVLNAVRGTYNHTQNLDDHRNMMKDMVDESQ
jgi:hypothetical protein